MDDMNQRLESIAPKMNSLRRRWFPRLYYDMLADALWWSDERPDFEDAEDHWCLRPVFRYRTTLILGTPDSNHESFWQAARRFFPGWPGFAPSRCKPSDKLTAFFHRCHNDAMEEFENIPD